VGNVLKKILDLVSQIGGNTLYYPGCLTRFVAPEIAERYQKILDMIGLDIITIPEFNCCGSPVQAAGFHDDFVDLIRKNKDIFKKYGVKRIITNCPACSKIFKDIYEIPTEHITETLVKHLDKIPEGKYSEPICYHDPCHLSRGRGVTEEPRKILSHLGFELVEMSNYGKKSLCCGGGGGVKSNYPEISNKIAKIRLSQCKTKKLVTSCPLCYKNLKENASKRIQVLELSEVIS
jgi:Fe-S oxidoreductase